MIQQKNELCVYLEKIREYLCNYNDKKVYKQKNFDDDLNKILHNFKTFVKLWLLVQQSAICISQPLHNFNFHMNSSVLQWIKFHISEEKIKFPTSRRRHWTLYCWTIASQVFVSNGDGVRWSCSSVSCTTCHTGYKKTMCCFKKIKTNF